MLTDWNEIQDIMAEQAECVCDSCGWFGGEYELDVIFAEKQVAVDDWVKTGETANVCPECQQAVRFNTPTPNIDDTARMIGEIAETTVRLQNSRSEYTLFHIVAQSSLRGSCWLTADLHAESVCEFESKLDNFDYISAGRYLRHLRLLLENTNEKA